MRRLQGWNRAQTLVWAGKKSASALPLVLRDHRDAILHRFRTALQAEEERRGLFLLLPVCFGLGILLYFSAEGEPGAAWPATLAAGCGCLTFLLRKRRAAAWIALAVCMICAGFTAAVWRTESVKRPVLERTTIGKLEGRVLSVDQRPQQSRVLVEVTAFAGLRKSETPERVRVSVRDTGSLRPGDTIRATARLLPPPEPVRPGGYHFARDAYFARIGGVGSIMGKIEIVAAPQTAGWQAYAMAALERERNALNSRIAAVYGGQAGAVAAALVTGKRGLIEEDTNEALRASGVYHIVSISGLHMALASGAMFWSVRALLALSPMLALRWPIRKIAAVAAMIGGISYCIFSGANVATVRAMIMTMIMLGAIVMDRPAFSMRNLAIAALIVMAIEPETILGPSFQMSFAAVAGLIALYDRRGLPHADIWDHPGSEPRSPRKGGFGFVDYVFSGTSALLKTTLVASAATAPFAAYHFHTANPYSLIGNLTGLPFVSMLGMPSALAGAFLYPLGLDWPFWWAMGLAMDAVIRISQFIETLPTARTSVTAFGPAALLALVVGLLLATLASTWLRWLAIVPVVTGILLAASAPRPDILIDRQASGAAIRTSEGRLAFVGRPSAFVMEHWLAADGDANPTDGADRVAQGCDRLGCVVRLPDGRVVAFIRHVAAMPEDCARADIVILQIRRSEGCAAKLVIDRDMLDRRGAIAVHTGISRDRLIGALDGSLGRTWSRPQSATRTDTRNTPAPNARPRPGSRPGATIPDEQDLQEGGEAQ